jgi:hypothetical protein
MSQNSERSSERRRVKRRAILDSFSLFVVMLKKGPYRLSVGDLSELGIGFDVDLEEDPDTTPLSVGEILDLEFYLNQSLYIPLQARVMRIEADENGDRRVGAEFVRSISGTPEISAITDFVKMLDSVSAIAEVRVD